MRLVKFINIVTAFLFLVMVADSQAQTKTGEKGDTKKAKSGLGADKHDKSVKGKNQKSKPTSKSQAAGKGGKAKSPQNSQKSALPGNKLQAVEAKKAENEPAFDAKEPSPEDPAAPVEMTKLGEGRGDSQNQDVEMSQFDGVKSQEAEMPPFTDSKLSAVGDYVGRVDVFSFASVFALVIAVFSLWHANSKISQLTVVLKEINQSIGNEKAKALLEKPERKPKKKGKAA